MLFTLEALEAQEGDCLILHYGDAGAPRFIVIDGGPGDTYQRRLKPRLQQLKSQWSPAAPLPIEMLMVSHIDRDHIDGVLDWTGEMIEQRDSGQPAACEINTLWHNSFDDLVGNDRDGLVAALAARLQVTGRDVAVPAGIGVKPSTVLVLAGVQEGRNLRENAKKLGLLLNTGFRLLVQAPSQGRKTLNWGDGLSLTVISPQADRLARLQKKWDETVEDLRRKGKLAEPQALAEAAAYADQSVFNLSSMVVLAEVAGKRMLLTGDARGDDVLEGLEAAGLLAEDKIHVDILKMPHHGSNRNVKLEFFERITADHYVISADGKNGNPEDETLEWILKAGEQASITLYLTNREGEEGLGPRLTKFFSRQQAAYPNLGVRFRDESAPSVKVDLLDAVSY